MTRYTGEMGMTHLIGMRIKEVVMTQWSVVWEMMYM